LARIIATIIAALMLIGGFMIGMVALLVIAGVGLVAGLAIWARVAWIKRQFRKSGVDLNAGFNPTTVAPKEEPGQVIEAEYTVISEREE
jgi:hypothetical protein